MCNPIKLTERELKEIQFCMYYSENYMHGTMGHNSKVIVAKMAYAMGFHLDKKDGLIAPENVTLDKK